MNTLTAISPIDGRYRQKTVDLSHYFSEFALIGYRIMVEVEYFIALCKLPLPQLADVTEEHFVELRSVYESFDLEQAEEIKATEKITNHDVKAVEYFIKNHLQESKRKIVNPFSLEYWNTNSISNENVRQEINKREKLIKENKLLYDYFYDKYVNSTIHSQNLNIIELN